MTRRPSLAVAQRAQAAATARSEDLNPFEVVHGERGEGNRQLVAEGGRR
jgi:hypothetical protein